MTGKHDPAMEFGEFTREELTEMFVNQRMRVIDIAIETGYSDQTISRYLKRFGISVRDRSPFTKQHTYSGSHRPKEQAYKDIIFMVLERDGYACIKCERTMGLQVHHKLSWKGHPDHRYDIANMVTLCTSCHRKEHPELPDRMFH